MNEVKLVVKGIIAECEEMIAYSEDNWMELHMQPQDYIDLKEALEKQIPIKPIESDSYEGELLCPICQCEVTPAIMDGTWLDALLDNEWSVADNYCKQCGQKLDWSE